MKYPNNFRTPDSTLNQVVVVLKIAI